MRNVKSIVLFVIMTFALNNNTKAQYVTLTDSNFVTWLSQYTSIAPCFNGNQLDTTCPALLNLHKTYISTYGLDIRNLDGFHYLKNLDTLEIFGSISDTAGLGLEQSTTLPLPIHLKYLLIEGTKLSQLPPLSDTLLFLDCSFNKLTNLPSPLPKYLTDINCSSNQLTQLPTLPSTLIILWCYNNLLSNLPPLPTNLNKLFCGSNSQLIQPILPASLKNIDCSSNGWSVLPLLPNSLQTLGCSLNQLSALPVLPNSLISLYCDHNLLSSLSQLPIGLYNLVCNHNQLSTLPTLPLSLTQIDCSNNQIVSLPELPDNMYLLDCSNNANLHCLPELKTMQCGTHHDDIGLPVHNVCLNFYGTAINCVPDYGNISYSTPSVYSLPRCDSINPDNCTSYNYNSISETTSVHFNLSPNPCSNFVTIKLFESARTTVQLMDITGKEIANYSFDTSNFNLETSNLSSGVYFLKLTDSKGKSAISKLIKQ